MKKSLLPVLLVLLSVMLVACPAKEEKKSDETKGDEAKQEMKGESRDEAKDEAKDESKDEAKDESKDEAKDEGRELKIVKVASHTSPMTDMLELIKEDMKEEGYALEVVKVSDNVQANMALHNKEVDANFFQHRLFMEMFNQGNDAKLVHVQSVYDAVVAFYGRELKSIEDLKEGAEVAIPSDPTNMTRALRLLAEHKLITLKEPDSYSVTLEDIAENPKNLAFTPISLLNLNEAYNEKDMIFNYPAYATKIGLSPEKDGLLVEQTGDMTFAVSLVAREDNKDSEAIMALKKVMTGDKIRDFIETQLANVAKVAF